MPSRTIHTLAELDTCADEILSSLIQRRSVNVLALHGDLGAGKTAFTQLLAKKLGVQEHVVSPTFMIMRMYDSNHKTFTKLVHIDAYRIEDIREIEVLKIPDYFEEKNNLVCIEWPERMSALVPEEALKVSLVLNGDGSRTITYDD